MDMQSVHALVEEIKATPEYEEYERTRALALENDLNKSLIAEMKRLQRAVQAEALLGREVDDVTQKRLQKLGEMLQFNAEAADFLLAEYKFSLLLSEVYKTLGEGVGMGLDVWKD